MLDKDWTWFIDYVELEAQNKMAETSNDKEK